MSRRTDNAVLELRRSEAEARRTERVFEKKSMASSTSSLSVYSPDPNR